jgi:hypothetical protein
MIVFKSEGIGAVARYPFLRERETPPPGVSLARLGSGARRATCASGRGVGLPGRPIEGCRTSRVNDGLGGRQQSTIPNCAPPHPLDRFNRVLSYTGCPPVGRSSRAPLRHHSCQTEGRARGLVAEEASQHLAPAGANGFYHVGCDFFSDLTGAFAIVAADPSDGLIRVLIAG